MTLIIPRWNSTELADLIWKLKLVKKKSKVLSSELRHLQMHSRNQVKGTVLERSPHLTWIWAIECMLGGSFAVLLTSKKLT